MTTICKQTNVQFGSLLNQLTVTIPVGSLSRFDKRGLFCALLMDPEVLPNAHGTGLLAGPMTPEDITEMQRLVNLAYGKE